MNHGARVVWERGDAVFTDNRYSRRHRIEFDGGATLAGSSSPTVVRAPYSDPSAVDPEEQFVASLSSCHMLWFLSIAAKKKFRVDRYEDDAEGVMEKNTEGKTAITRVTLRPRVTFSGEKIPTAQEIAELHHEAHEECFIASSVKTEVRVEPVS
ncbi:MAG TPA: OsmC family protein [Usitatibacter sp.]|nr:OsmC family protein [Usitatibacter sp.]